MFKSAFSILIYAFLMMSQLLRADAAADPEPSEEVTQPPTPITPDAPTPFTPAQPTPMPPPSPPTPVPKAPIETSFSTFTGQINKNKVRMRLEPNTESPIIRELNSGEMLLILGEAGDFYAVEAPADLKAYIFRTYVLDGVIEGNHVNVRLEPDLSAPVIGQMHSGDHVKGTISSEDKRWLEISPPASTRFYISKDYVKKIGNASLISNLKHRRQEIIAIIDNARMTSQVELQKPFNQIDLNPITQKLTKVITQHTDNPQEVAEAKELLNSIMTAYLNKKVAYMESATQNTPTSSADNPTKASSFGPPSWMSLWIPSEQALYEEWKKQNEHGSKEEFYQEQTRSAKTLNGIIEPYNRLVKNKPGDYILINPSTRLPVGYLYSTRVNLQDLVGHQVTLKGVSRPNQNFAYPAWYILAVE